MRMILCRNKTAHLSPSLPPCFQNDPYCVEWDIKLYYNIPPSLPHSLPILMAIFPGEPELASFIGAKDNGGGGDN